MRILSFVASHNYILFCAKMPSLITICIQWNPNRDLPRWVEVEDGWCVEEEAVGGVQDKNVPEEGQGLHHLRPAWGFAILGLSQMIWYFWKPQTASMNILLLDCWLVWRHSRQRVVETSPERRKSGAPTGSATIAVATVIRGIGGGGVDICL